MEDAELPRRVGIGLLCTLVVVSGLWFIAAGGRRMTVILTVETDTRTVSTSAPTVGHLLAEERVSVFPSDIVRPPVAAPVIDGLRVEVKRSRSIGVTLDGQRSTRVTVARTVRELLDGAGIDVPEGSVLDPPLRTPIVEGLEVKLRRPSAVTLRHDAAEEVVVTTAPTVRQLLSERGISWKAEDVIEPGLTILPEHRLVVTVSRSGTHEYTVREKVPPPLLVTEDASRPRDQEIVVAPGKEGFIERLYRTVVVDGAIKSRSVVRETVLEEPEPRSIVRGTKWTPLGAPDPLPGEEIPDVPVQEGSASWYHRAGMTAAHRTLPFGTLVKVTNLATGASVYVTIDDRGPYVEGRVIDLSDGAYTALAALESGVINVRIEW